MVDVDEASMAGKTRGSGVYKHFPKRFSAIGCPVITSSSLFYEVKVMFSNLRRTATIIVGLRICASYTKPNLAKVLTAFIEIKLESKESVSRLAVWLRHLLDDQALVQRYLDVAHQIRADGAQRCRSVVVDEYFDGVMDGYVRRYCRDDNAEEMPCDACCPD
ncbi:hypothetical protein V8E54_002391 [Elaphomyces granulatus]